MERVRQAPLKEMLHITSAYLWMVPFQGSKQLSSTAEPTGTGGVMVLRGYHGLRRFGRVPMFHASFHCSGVNRLGSGV